MCVQRMSRGGCRRKEFQIPERRRASNTLPRTTPPARLLLHGERLVGLRVQRLWDLACVVLSSKATLPARSEGLLR